MTGSGSCRHGTGGEDFRGAGMAGNWRTRRGLRCPGRPEKAPFAIIAAQNRASEFARCKVQSCSFSSGRSGARSARYGNTPENGMKAQLLAPPWCPRGFHREFHRELKKPCDFSTLGRIRTCDLLIRSQLLYPAELRGQKKELRPAGDFGNGSPERQTRWGVRIQREPWARLRPGRQAWLWYVATNHS